MRPTPAQMARIDELYNKMGVLFTQRKRAKDPDDARAIIKELKEKVGATKKHLEEEEQE